MSTTGKEYMLEGLQRYFDGMTKKLANMGIPEYTSKPLVLTRTNRVVLNGDDLWKLKDSIPVPYTTTGIWATDKSKFELISTGAIKRNVVYVDDHGADPTGVTDSASSINEAAALVAAGGGGQLVFPGNKYTVTQPVDIHTGVHYLGRGRGATTISAAPGSNVDVFKTVGFDTLTGGGNVADAPYAFSLKDMSIDGNYLDLSGTLTWRNSDRVLNTHGCGIKIYGSRFDLDVEVCNVADNALYCEGGGKFHENQEHASRIQLTGRISGQEGIVFRGPGDINMDYVIFGICGHMPLSKRKTSDTSLSRLYPGMNCVGLMLDNSTPFTGHVELGMVHIYAVSYNYGVYTKGTNRFNARHVVSENSLGGFYFGEGAHGVAGIVEARANGRMPDAYTGNKIVGLKDVDLDNGTIWNLSAVIKSYRYLPSRATDNYLVDISGHNNNVRCSIFSQLQPSPLNKPLAGNALRVSGNNNTVSVTSQRITGTFVHVLGNGNNISGACAALYDGTGLIRENGFGNTINLSITSINPASTGFKAIGVVGLEDITLMMSGSIGYKPFDGDAPAALNRAALWNISAANGGSINAKSTDTYAEMTIPQTEIAGTMVVPHNFLYKPHRVQVTPSYSYPGTPPNQMLNIGVVDTSETDVTLHYRWSAVPTSGGANVSLRIK